LWKIFSTEQFMNYNIAETLPRIAKTHPDRIGLICRAGMHWRSWSFKELDQLADSFAYTLKDMGVNRGNRTMLMVRPSVEFITLTFALFKIGAIIILIDPGMGYRNLLKCISSVSPEIFIGIRRAHLFRHVFPDAFKTVRTSVYVGPSLGLLGQSHSAATARKSRMYGTPFQAADMQPDDPAAILFTTGSTGPPKGVLYEHAIFQAQLQLIREHYTIGPDDIDQPAFPLFALFSTGLGACSVIPEMNPAKPARVNAKKFVHTIRKNKVTYSFGSPAIWNVVSRYCLEHDITMPTVRKILMAGAPVPGELLQRTLAVLSPDAEIHTPYGATESLPVASITAREVLAETWDKTRKGQGICVGRPLPGIEIRIIKISDKPVEKWLDSLQLPAHEVGEIIVRGPVVTRAYDNNTPENRLAKIKDNNGFWHRMGDLGYFDDDSRLWFCGRKGQRVVARNSTLFTVCCEAIFNEHPAVFRSALVGVGSMGDQKPVLIVEVHGKRLKGKALYAELQQLALQNELTRQIEHFLVHPGFPVDIRHNAKIFREELALWAADRLKKEIHTA
jgi:acyl-CoA synthetase (AMP-forming)/AMP-acid ligase II